MKVTKQTGTAGPQNTFLAHALVACVLIVIDKATGVSFDVPEVAILQGGLGGLLALLLPCLGS